MKRAVSISLLLLANIIILAHAVVPHHHHNGVFVALLENNYTGSSEDHDHDSDNGHHQHKSNPHQHENNGVSERWSLNEVIPVQMIVLKVYAMKIAIADKTCFPSFRAL